MSRFDLIVKDLVDIWCIHLRGSSNDFPWWWDIDLFCSKKYISIVQGYLSGEGFSIVKADNDYIHFKYFDQENWFIYFVDITIGFKYVFDLFPWIQFKQKFLQRYLKNPQKLNIAMSTIRYIMAFRKWKKYKNFFDENKEDISNNNFYLHTITSIPFRKNLNISIINNYLDRNIYTLFRYIKTRYIISVLYVYIYNIYKNINRWKIIVLLGTDWVWKTTIA